MKQNNPEEKLHPLSSCTHVNSFCGDRPIIYISDRSVGKKRSYVAD